MTVLSEMHGNGKGMTMEQEMRPDVNQQCELLTIQNRELLSQNQQLMEENTRLRQEKEWAEFCLNETRNSITYRLGSALTYIPRKLKKTDGEKALLKDKSRSDAEMPYVFELTDTMFRASHITKDHQVTEVYEVPIEYIFWGGKITIPMSVEEGYTDRVLWIHEMSDEEFRKTGEYHAKGDAKGVMCAYSNTRTQELYLILFTTLEQVYKRFIHFSSQNAKAVLRGKSLYVSFKGVIYSAKKDDLPISKIFLAVDENNFYEIDLPYEELKENYGKIRLKIPVKEILEKETSINNPIHILVFIGDCICKFNLGKKDKKEQPTKFQYVPSSSVKEKEWILFIRKNANQNYSLVVRRKEAVENTIRFLILESKPVSFILYHLGKLARKHHKKKVNLYFEKNSMKAEEGTYQIFTGALESKKTRNYFILDKHAEEWESLSKQRHVIERYSLRYYWLLYVSDCFISTETSSHLNVHRAVNKYVRKALLERPLIFLQHGVTYLKCQGNSSTFGKGKEGEPTYMIVGSEKEKIAVCRMLKLNEEQCIVTGLPIFSTIEYEHINSESEDVVTIMLTWKMSEEHLLTHFQDSVYYKNAVQIYQLMSRYVERSKIRIVPHPKVQELLLSTDLKDFVWKDSVSEALKDTKLLITDYSSVCYNAFYQGAAVVFYQSDLKEYEAEVGKLIPEPEEYIGWRTFNLEQLEKIISEGVLNGRIDLEFLRTQEFRKRYDLINSFNDGKNTERIISFLKEKEIV